MTDLADQPAPQHDPPLAYPAARTSPFAVPEPYVRQQESGAITRVRLNHGEEAWFVTRLAEAREILMDTGTFSSDRRRPGFPVIATTTSPAEQRQAMGIRTPWLIGMDPPEHTAERRAVVGEFTLRRLDAMRPRVQQITDELIDDMLAAGPPADLVHALALPVPSLVICELLGVPYADHEFFQRNSSLLIGLNTALEDRQKASADLLGYLYNLIVSKENQPGEDLLSRQIMRYREAGRYDRETMMGVALILLVAGHETTANMISLGALALLEHPDQLAAMQADPSRTLPAVEELLRYFGIVEGAVRRVATRDVEIGGVRIRAQDAVIVQIPVVNRDPGTFADPHVLDVGRAARSHLSFGFGPHQCLGQNLARLELQIVFDTLFRRIPGLRLDAPVADLPVKDDALVFGLNRLPVAW
jgi:cytochrome P450